MVAFYGGGIDRVQQGYCITFKMKFETKKNNFSQDTESDWLSHFQSSSRAEKQKSTIY
jgi:hypothetical protein